MKDLQEPKTKFKHFQGLEIGLLKFEGFQDTYELCMYHSNGAIIMSFKTHSYYLPFFLCFITFWQFVHLSPCVSKECFHCGIRTPTRTSKQLSTFKLMAAACIWQTKAFATFAANILFLCMNCHVMLEKERDQNFGKIIG